MPHRSSNIISSYCLRGRLAQVLMKIKILAKDLPDDSARIQIAHESEDDSQDENEVGGEMRCQACCATTSTASDEMMKQLYACNCSRARTSISTPGSISVSTTAAASATTHMQRTQSPKLMKNFRELLWFWQEYYLRRGRDRLSLEFSSHIPFIYWQTLVEMLCADDGSATALLHQPISLPLSPYKIRSLKLIISSQQQLQQQGVWYSR
jgi:hypothetical protein